MRREIKKLIIMFWKKKDTKKAFDKGREEFSESHVAEIIENEEKLTNHFKNDKNLSGYFSDFILLFSLLKDYFSGTYREIPWKTIAAVGATLLYVLSPFDLVADIIPLVGFADDAAVFAFCLKMISGDLEKYREWKNLNESL